MDALQPGGLDRGEPGLIGPRESARQQHGDNFVGFRLCVSQHPDELARGGLRGRRVRFRDPHLPVEIQLLQLHPVTERFVPEHHLQRHQRDVMPIQNRVRKIRRGVGHHDHRPPLAMRQLSVLGPHVLGFGGLDTPPPSCESKDGVRGVGVHMDLENVPRQRDLYGATEAADLGAHLVAGWQLLAPDGDLCAILEVAFRGDLDEGRRHLEGVRVGERRRRKDGIALDVPDHPFEHADKPLSTGVHDPRLAENLQ